jgi:hypothetical protein
MRNLVCSVAAIAALAFAGCGASSKEVAMAKTAHYKGDKAQIFEDMKATVEADYQIEKADPAALEVDTNKKWYSPEGMVVTRTGSANNGEGMVPDRSISFGAVVQLVPDGESYVVKVSPVMMQYHAGSPKPSDIHENDADAPGWSHDRVDTLAIKIHKALQKYEVKSGGPQMVPAGGEAPAAGSAAGSADASGSAAAPAAGSAAP